MKRLFRLTKSFFNRAFIQVVAAGLSLVFFIYVVRNEHLDSGRIRSLLSSADTVWVIGGIVVTALYLILQALLYVYSFQSIGVSISLGRALKLFLKRNFVSTFLPAGAFTSLAFFDDELDPYSLQKVQIRYGSFLFALASMISVVIIAIPVMGILLFRHEARSVEIYGILFLASVIGLIVYVGDRLAKQKGMVFRYVRTLSPGVVLRISELSRQDFRLPVFIKACLLSLVIELAGVAHLYITLAALGLTPSLEAPLLGYVIMIIILSISPFLRGIGAIEVSVTYVLTLYGYAPLPAASVTILFRFFEFWLPFFLSAILFLVRKGNLLLRVFPAFFIMVLGAVNIVSALTPAIPERLRLLNDFIPFSITEFSNIAVLLMGLIMIITAAFLLTGARNAWRTALIISLFSLLGHLTKAFDYEEASLALVTSCILWYTRKAYFVKYDITFQLRAAEKILILISALFVYAVAGFYLLRVRHLGFDFTMLESVRAAFKAVLFLTDNLTPHTRTGEYFLYSIQAGSALVLLYGLFSIYQSSKTTTLSPADRHNALSILEHSGHSSMDYFKVYPDKQLFFNEPKDSFLSFSESKHYAVVMEDPVAPCREKGFQLILDFEDYCSRHGLRTFYYRVPEESLSLYQCLKKKSLLLGQEAIVDLETFSTGGSHKKALRHAVRKIEDAGYRFNAYHEPLKDGLLQQLKSVSDDWLHHDGHGEAGFSQGVFNAAELKKCTVLTVENKESRILAFLNIIPSYKAGEATYDLVRQSGDAPNGALDYLIMKMIEFFKDNGYKTLNMGLVPMAGMHGSNLNEQVLQFYRDHFRQASRFKGLFDHKNKFEPRWENRYLIYDEVYDLIRFPGVLRAVSG
jgi:phosphatidylglycerol lysyltransferase